MKTLKLISILIAILTILVSCNQTKKQSHKHNVNKEISVIDTNPTIRFDNPAIFGGSNFGSFLKILWKLGQFEEMLKYTSQFTIDKFGEEKIVDFYSKINFGYDIRLKGQTKKDSIIILNYETSIIATKGIIRMPIVVENDTVRIILEDLNVSEYFLIK